MQDIQPHRILAGCPIDSLLTPVSLNWDSLQGRRATKHQMGFVSWSGHESIHLIPLYPLCIKVENSFWLVSSCHSESTSCLGSPALGIYVVLDASRAQHTQKKQSSWRLERMWFLFWAVTYLLSKEIPSLVRLLGVAPKSKDLGMRTWFVPVSTADHQCGLDSVSSLIDRIELNYL